MANPRKFSEKIALMNQRQAEGDAAFQAIMREVNESLTTPSPQVNVTRPSGPTQQNAAHVAMMGGGPRSHKLSSGDVGGLPLSAMLSAPSANMNMASLGVGVGGAFPPLNHTASLPNVNQVGAHPNGAHQGPGPMQQAGGYSQFGAPQPNVNSMMQTGLVEANSGGIDLATALSNLENMKSGKQVLANKLHSSRARQLLAPGGAQLGAPIRRPNHVDKRVDASPTGNMLAPFLSPPAAFDALWRRTHSDSAINQSAAVGAPQAQPGGPSQTFLAPSRFDQSPNAAANQQQQQAQNQQNSPSHRASTPTAMAAANAGAPSYLHRELAIAKSSSYFAMPNALAHTNTGMQQLPAFHPTSVRSRSCEISPSALRNALSNGGAAQCSPHEANPSGTLNGVNEREVAQYGVGLANTQTANCGQFLTAGAPGSGPNWGGAPASTYLSTPNIAYLTSCAGAQPQNAQSAPNQNPNQLCVGVAMGGPGPSPGSASGPGGTPMFATPYSQNAVAMQHQQQMDGNSSQLLSSSLPTNVPFQPTGSLPDLSYFQQPPRLTPGAGGGGGGGGGSGAGGQQSQTLNFQYTPSMMRKPVPAPLVMNAGAQPGGGLYSPTNMSPVRLPYYTAPITASPTRAYPPHLTTYATGAAPNFSPLSATTACAPPMYGTASASINGTAMQRGPAARSVCEMLPLTEEPEREREQELDDFNDKLPRICIFEPSNRNEADANGTQPATSPSATYSELFADDAKFKTLLDELDQLDSQNSCATEAATLRNFDTGLLDDDASLFAISNLDERDAPFSFDALYAQQPQQDTRTATHSVADSSRWNQPQPQTQTVLQSKPSPVQSQTFQASQSQAQLQTQVPVQIQSPLQNQNPHQQTQAHAHTVVSSQTQTPSKSQVSPQTQTALQTQAPHHQIQASIQTQTPSKSQLSLQTQPAFQTQAVPQIQASPQPQERTIIRPVYRHASVAQQPPPNNSPASSLTLAALLGDDRTVHRARPRRSESPRRKSSSDYSDAPPVIAGTTAHFEDVSLLHDSEIAKALRSVVRSSSSGSLRPENSENTFKLPFTPAPHSPAQTLTQQPAQSQPLPLPQQSSMHASIVQRLETQLRHTNLGSAPASLPNQSQAQLQPRTDVLSATGPITTSLLAPADTDGDESETDERLGATPATTGSVQQRSKRKHSQPLAPSRVSTLTGVYGGPNNGASTGTQQSDSTGSGDPLPNRKTSITVEIPAKRNVTVVRDYE